MGGETSDTGASNPSLRDQTDTMDLLDRMDIFLQTRPPKLLTMLNVTSVSVLS